MFKSVSIKFARMTKHSHTEALKKPLKCHSQIATDNGLIFFYIYIFFNRETRA